MMRFILALMAFAIASPALSQVSYPPPVLTNVPTKTEMQSAINSITATIPTPATTVPPGVTDTGSQGTMTTIYALANHTHASKARKGRVLVPTTNTLDVVFSPVFSGTPICAVTAETTKNDNNVVNAQMDGTPTATGMTIRITRTAITNAALINLTVLSVATPLATYAHYVCLEP